MNIAFLSNKLTLRGTEVALYNYAHYNETILNNKSIIITRDFNKITGAQDIHIDAYTKFNNRFPVFYYENVGDIEIILKKNKIDIIFVEKAGSPTDNLTFSSCKTLIHSVFTLKEPHGDAYTSLSEWLNIHCDTNYPVIPYMIDIYDTNENLRNILNIPDSAIVYGTYSGADCFNIDYVKQCVKDITISNIYFIFLNIDKFTEQKNVIFLPGTTDMKYKRMFINTCDAMLYGRDGGETFGLSCGEFSLCNKPIIARSHEHSASHLHILENKMIKHSSYTELYDILTDWNKYKIDVSDNNYKKFTPEYAMKQFKIVCDSLFKYKETINVCFNGFWAGFLDGTNPVKHTFFINLLELAFKKNIKISTKEYSDILFESLFEPSILNFKQWKYSFFFSGESRIPINHLDYTCILSNRKNSGNNINLPEFITYIYSSLHLPTLEKMHLTIQSNPKCPYPIASIISNPHCNERNYLLHYLQSHFPVVNFGDYMNNVGGKILPQYNSEDFNKILSQFHFILAFENSIEETYITEKIFHAFQSNTIPIYYGASTIFDYINPERILHIKNLEETTLTYIKNKIEYLLKNPHEYISILQKPIFTNGSLQRTIVKIATDIEYLLFKPNSLSNISSVYCIVAKEFEEIRYIRLESLFNSIQWNVKNICPTYKHTITSEIYSKYVKTDEIFTLRNLPLKKAELSLSLNFLEIFNTIRTNFSSGNFLLFESDIRLNGNIDNINKIINVANKNRWDCIHIGLDINTKITKGEIEEDDIILSRQYTPRGNDSMIWTYNGILKFLHYIENVIFYDLSLPFDYIYINFFKSHTDNFFFYWSEPTIFIQGSNAGLEPSTIQKDTE